MARVFRVLVALLIVAVPRAALACPVCFGQNDSPLATMYVMARGARIYDGPDEVHRMVVARRILKAFAMGNFHTIVTLFAREDDGELTYLRRNTDYD